MRGVYAVGRRGLTPYGRWMAAVISCGPEALLSYRSAAALWRIVEGPQGEVEVSVISSSARRRPGLRVHRRPSLGPIDLTTRYGIPVTCPVRTLLDVAPMLRPHELEAAANAADRLDLIDPESLRRALGHRGGQPGVALLCRVLDRRTFRLTDSELERRLLRLAARAGLPTPLTGERINGFKVDFIWPAIGLVVEADGLRYHRTAAEQAQDRIRDQAHTRAGLTPLRFTHAQVRYERDEVVATLAAVARRLALAART